MPYEEICLKTATLIVSAVEKYRDLRIWLARTEIGLDVFKATRDTHMASRDMQISKVLTKLVDLISPPSLK